MLMAVLQGVCPDKGRSICSPVGSVSHCMHLPRQILSCQVRMHAIISVRPNFHSRDIFESNITRGRALAFAFVLTSYLVDSCIVSFLCERRVTALYAAVWSNLHLSAPSI